MLTDIGFTIHEIPGEISSDFFCFFCDVFICSKLSDILIAKKYNITVCAILTNELTTMCCSNLDKKDHLFATILDFAEYIKYIKMPDCSVTNFNKLLGGL